MVLIKLATLLRSQFQYATQIYLCVLNVGLILRLGFITGNPRVGISHTAPVTRDTVPATVTGTHRTRLGAVSYGVTITR
jgi:hypothetical protein